MNRAHSELVFSDKAGTWVQRLLATRELFCFVDESLSCVLVSVFPAGAFWWWMFLSARVSGEGLRSNFAGDLLAPGTEVRNGQV
jgi:hypothetical protein